MLQPRTKAAVMKGVELAVERLGGVASAAFSLGLKYERFSGVVAGKSEVPPQWVDGFIAYGDGRVGVDGFLAMRKKFLLSQSVMSGLKAGKARAKDSKTGTIKRMAVERYKLIQIGSELRLIEPNAELPKNARYLYRYDNQSVYMDGKLRYRFLATPLCERERIVKS